jgi:uncharacterized protein
MVIDKSFRVGAPADALWTLIKDLPRVLPHIPGAQLLASASAGVHTAGFRMQRGPLQGTYTTALTVQSMDDSTRTAVVHVTAADEGGRGSVDATVSVTVAPSGVGSVIAVHADVEGTGEAAALGQHLAQGASPTAGNEFVANLERALRPKT